MAHTISRRANHDRVLSSRRGLIEVRPGHKPKALVEMQAARVEGLEVTDHRGCVRFRERWREQTSSESATLRLRGDRNDGQIP